MFSDDARKALVFATAGPVVGLIVGWAWSIVGAIILLGTATLAIWHGVQALRTIQKGGTKVRGGSWATFASLLGALWIFGFLGVAWLSVYGGPSGAGGAPNLDCGELNEYLNETMSYGFCYDGMTVIKSNLHGPTVATGRPENVNVVARDGPWASLADYRAANEAQMRDRSVNFTVEPATLGGQDAWRHTTGPIPASKYDPSAPDHFELRFETVMTVRDGVGFLVTYTATPEGFDKSHELLDVMESTWTFG